VNKFVEYIGKNFKLATNILFIIAILIIGGQIFIGGLDSIDLRSFLAFYKPLNILFGTISILLSFYLFITARNKYVILARFIFLLISFFNLLFAILWILNSGYEIMDTAAFSQFFAVFIGFLSISFKISSLGNSSIHPATLFVLSFIFLILFGTFCLMLPAASIKNVSFVQALFTSTSAVTVTGLAILDTGKDFTIFGQTIILILIQLGGLGVLTITNIFALLFKSSSSFKNRMMVSDMIKELDNRNTFSTLFKIVLLTVIVETIGAILIYFTIANDPNITKNPTFFAVFHSISAFCNGGFSTLTNSLYEESVRFNYGLQLTVCWLIITGGLGYAVMINHYALLKNWILSNICKFGFYGFQYQKELKRTSTNSRIILVTTTILLLMGTLLFFATEYDRTLNEHSLWGKIVVSFFNSTTPRTAGFNNVNMADLGIPAFMLTLALMWIGASPGSTGGGIKTTTFAVALLNLYNQIRGRERLVINFRVIPSIAINQVNAVIMLSIFAISFSTFLLSWMNPTLTFKDLLFESISAYSTVGLSTGITASLTPTSHVVLVIVMFLGRVSFLTFLIGIFSYIFKEDKTCEPYYPKENVFIN
jgi:trk system potassium uptake protein